MAAWLLHANLTGLASAVPHEFDDVFDAPYVPSAAAAIALIEAEQFEVVQYGWPFVAVENGTYSSQRLTKFYHLGLIADAVIAFAMLALCLSVGRRLLAGLRKTASGSATNSLHPTDPE